MTLQPKYSCFNCRVIITIEKEPELPYDPDRLICPLCSTESDLTELEKVEEKLS